MRPKKLIETYFGDIPSQPLPPDLDVSEPTDVAATYREWEDKLAPFPAFLIGWKIPQRRTPEFYASLPRRQGALRRRKLAALSKAGKRRRIGHSALWLYR